MSTEARPDALSRAIGHLQRVIGDDYVIRAVAVDDVSVDVRVLARDEACAECIVPKDVMRDVADDYLSGTGYRVRVLTYPDDPA